jgi:hypothetical protein
MMVCILSVAWRVGWADESTPTPTPTPTRIVEGVSPILQQNQAEARKQALRMSLQQALEQTVADLVTVDTLVANLETLKSRIYSRALRYVRSYRVLWEYPDVAQKVYRIQVEADVALQDVAQEIEALGLMQAGGAAPQLLLLVQERPLRQAQVLLEGEAKRLMTEALRDYLRTQHFRILELQDPAAWDGQESTAFFAGKKIGADVVLVGVVDVHKTHDQVIDLSIQTVEATAQVRAWITATGEQLAFDRARATVDHADAALGGRQAIAKVTTAMTTRLVSTLQQYRHTYAGASMPPRP